MTKPPPQFVDAMLFDESVPVEMRLDLLRGCLASEDERAKEILTRLVNAAANGGESSEDLHARKARELATLIEEMGQGPLRHGTFLSIEKVNGNIPRAQILLTDGSTAFSVVPEEDLAKGLRSGDGVWLEANGRAVLFRDPNRKHVGEEARLERLLGNGLVEASLRDHGRSIFHASARLTEQIERGEAGPGDMVVVCSMRMMAFESVPREEGRSHYQYLEPARIPDVVIERDIACPPAFLAEVLDHVETDLHDPEILRRYRLRRAITALLVGPPGTGKTFSIDGLQNRLYRIMSEATGVPPEELPSRVMRFRPSKILSKWLGDSDKAIDQFFDELEELAGQHFMDPEGREWQLPILAIFEEADGMARERGEEPVYDRIQATLLQRLDACAGNRLRDLPVVCVFTTNTPHLVDPAFLRRAGGTTHRFGPLKSRRVFRAVLDRILSDRPVASFSAGGREALLSDVSSWLFSRNGRDTGQVAITYVGRTDPEVLYRRDFLTPGLVDRAVQAAASVASREERAGGANPGLTVRHLARAISDQVRAIVDRLTTHNAHQYVEVPDGLRPGTIRRLEQPPALDLELERAG